jgi:cyclin-dependent kinase
MSAARDPVSASVMYEKLEKIGEGTYGVVFKAKHRTTGAVVALKKIRIEVNDGDEEGIPPTAIREISILKQLRHPNIVRLFEVIHTDKSLSLVFEFMDRDLKNYLDMCGERGIDSYTTKSFVFQLLQGIAFIHKNKFLHRDLKPQNLLINSSGELKIADFGLARGFGIPVAKFTSEVATLWYRPPDILLGNARYTTSVDVWGAGCIFAEMCLGKAIFSGSTVDELLMLIFKALGTPLSQTLRSLPKFDITLPQYKAKGLPCLVPKLSSEGVSLLEQLLQMDPQLRVSAKDSLDHAYFSELRSGSTGITKATIASIESSLS